MTGRVRIDLDRLGLYFKLFFNFRFMIKRQSNFRSAGRQIDHPVFNTKKSRLRK